jgi:hypothetical protein
MQATGKQKGDKILSKANIYFMPGLWARDNLRDTGSQQNKVQVV